MPAAIGRQSLSQCLSALRGGVSILAREVSILAREMAERWPARLALVFLSLRAGRAEHLAPRLRRRHPVGRQKQIVILFSFNINAMDVCKTYLLIHLFLLRHSASVAGL
jgi:hypothetical protein